MCGLTCSKLHKGKLLLIVDVHVHHTGTCNAHGTMTPSALFPHINLKDCQEHTLSKKYRNNIPEAFVNTPGPAVVPPTAARAFEKKVAMFCSLPVGGRPPTYTLRAWRVACCDGGCAAAVHLVIIRRQHIEEVLHGGQALPGPA